LALGDGEAGEFLEEGDIGDEAVVDDFLGEVHELGLGAEGVAQGAALAGAEQLLVEGEAGEPTDFRFHRLRWGELGRARCGVPSAKAGGGAVGLAGRRKPEAVALEIARRARLARAVVGEALEGDAEINDAAEPPTESGTG